MIRASQALFIAVFTLGAPSLAHAQGDDPGAIAEALFREGRALMKADKAAAACPKFAESQRIEPKLGTLLNLAHCHAKIGRTATAWSEFAEARALAAQRGDAAREAFATKRVGELEASLSYLRIVRADPTAEMVVVLDGKELEAASLGTPLPVDPGEHHIVARAAGMQSWETTQVIAEGPGEVEVEIPALVALPVPAPIAPPPLPPRPAPPPIVAPPPFAGDRASSGGLSPLVPIGFSVAGAGVLLGAITGGLALSEGGSLECPQSECIGEQADALDTATTLANVSNVGFAIGGAGLVVGVIGVFLSFGDEEQAAVRVSPQSLEVRVAF